MIHSNSTHTDLIFVFISYVTVGYISLLLQAGHSVIDRLPLLSAVPADALTIAVHLASCRTDNTAGEKLLMHLLIPSSITLIRASLHARMYHQRCAC
jgi:hypothetical protein